MFGTSLRAHAACGFPLPSIGVSRQLVRAVGGCCGGSEPPPTNGSVGSYIGSAGRYEALQTVVSLKTTGSVSAADGSTVPWRDDSAGLLTMIIPYRPFMTWFVDEWWCGWYQKIPGRGPVNLSRKS